MNDSALLINEYSLNLKMIIQQYLCMRAWTLFIFLLPLTYSQCPSYSSPKCQFIFTTTECTFTYCILFGSEFNATEQTSQDWTYCLASCCSNPELSASQFADSLQKCCSGGSVEDNSTILYAFGLGVGLFLGLVFFLYCCGLDRLKLWLSNPIPQDKMEFSSIMINNSIAQPAANVLKMMITEESMPDSQLARTCCICLEGQTSVKATCGHQYHLKCIQEWYKRKKECPQCRAENNGRYKIQCQQCKTEALIDQFSLGEYSCKSCSV